MASRRETREQQRVVEQALRSLAGGGALEGGAMLPSVSEIAQQHGVSRYIAHRALQMMTEEGLFRAVPKVGSFASNLDAGAASLLFLTDDASPHPYREDVQIGFDSRVAGRGGMAVSLELSASCDSWQGLPASGVFLMAREERLDSMPPSWRESFAPGVPCVRIGSHWRKGEPLDLLSFDDEDGGYRATRHLIERGFKSIAFLGVHVPALRTSAKEWSSERERGFVRALGEAGLPFHGMAFWPERESDDDAGGATRIGLVEARAMLQRGDVRAVVAANDAVAMGLLQALREAGVPRDEWPAIVAFDNSEEARRHNITSLHLPWDEIGREAADLLWQRARGQLPPQPQHRAVAMRLIPRLSCRPRWPSRYLTGQLT